MTVYLLDANVLIALVDPHHGFHDRAEQWFAGHWSGGWATCPLTQNAVIRIVGSSRYPETPGPPSVVADLLRTMTAKPGHHFWADDISPLDVARVDPEWLRTSAQITDTYLLALAVAHGGLLATFDRRLVADAVTGGVDRVHLIAPE